MPKRLALLIGIDDYGEDSGLSTLNFAEADVDLVSTVLIDKGGFSTTVLKGRDATHDGIIRALRQFYEQKDLGLFVLYFAGHGEMLSEIGKFSLHCFGSEVQDTIGTLTLSEIAQRVRDKIPAPSAVLLIDACRSRMYRGAQPRGADHGLSASALADLRTISQQDVPRFWEPDSVQQAQEQFLITFMSCGVGQYSYEDSALGHGIFTYGLVQELRGCRGAVPLSDLRKRVGDFTTAHCKARKLVPVQVPEWVEPSISVEVYLGREPPLKNTESTRSSTEERRQARRFEMTLPCTLKLTHSPENVFPVRIKNISYRGAFLESDYPLGEGQEVWMELIIPKQLGIRDDKFIHLLGTVVRMERQNYRWKCAVAIHKYEFIPNST
jgi:uncharacterized caspase-like protein